jgi:predicted ABC-type ATPase
VEFVNADDIARGLSAFRPESVAVKAGRLMLARLEDLARQRVDFAFETTLSSRSVVKRGQDNKNSEPKKMPVPYNLS